MRDSEVALSVPSRREVLACLACSCALACAGDVGQDTSDTAGTDTGVDPDGVDGGHVDDYAVGDLEPIGGGIAVGLDEDGFFALSTVCTHRGCNMATRGEVSGDGLVCDCHGSEFRVDGTVRRGPARDPLPFYALAITPQGIVVVDPDTEVDAAVRVPRPATVGS